MGSKYLYGNNLPRISLSSGKLFPDRYLHPILASDFSCVCCCQSRWLSRGNRYGISVIWNELDLNDIESPLYYTLHMCLSYDVSSVTQKPKIFKISFILLLFFESVKYENNALNKYHNIL